MAERRYGVLLTDEERMQRHYGGYGTAVLPPRGTGLAVTATRASALSVSKADYLSRIKRTIAYERMLQIPEVHIPEWEPPPKTWYCLNVPESGWTLCGWWEEFGGVEYDIVIIIQLLPEFEYENPPRTTERAFFFRDFEEVEAIPDEVAEDSLNALPYEIPWGLIAASAGVVLVGGLMVRSARRR